jgi:exopolysaccharide production protein ExoQ
MPPFLALVIWFVLLLALLGFDPAKVRGTSLALWVPLTWMFIAGSRLPSQWLSGWSGGTVAQSLVDGNPLDRSIDLVLIALAIGILMSRSFQWNEFFRRNLALMALISFALVSVLWSDFPFVSFKRWFRDFGNYLVILVVLSDPDPLEAVRTVLRRLGYLLIPLCILLDKYYPNISRQYDPWTGIGMYAGATTGKNLLGLVALLSGLFFFWDTVARWSDRKERRTKRILLVNIAFLAMSFWVLDTANSATCRVCMALGCLVIAAAHSKMFRRHPGFLKVLIPGSFCLYVTLALGFGMSGDLAAAVGKDPTLTDRTVIWNIVLNMHTNPLIGTGYESFWLGPRLQKVWETMPGINEAHNGYLEVYLNLGIIGVLLIVGLLIASYRNICRRLTPFSNVASLYLALWAIMLFFSVTEAGFRSGLMWLVFLLGGIAVPGPAEDPVRNVAPDESSGAIARYRSPALQTRDQRTREFVPFNKL